MEEAKAKERAKVGQDEGREQRWSKETFLKPKKKQAPQTRDKVAAYAGISGRTLEEIKEHGEISPLTEEAAKPLMRERDDEVREEAISHVEKRLKRETPTGGPYEKLTAKDVNHIIKEIIYLKR